MAKNDWILPVVLLAGGYIWYTKFNGKATVDNLLGDLKGGGGLNLGGNSSGSSFTDDKGNNVNISGDGKICIAGKCYSGSGEDIQVNRQSNTGVGGSIIQKQSRNQKSTVFFTIPSRFGNL